MTGAVNYFNGKTDEIFNQVTKKYNTVPATAEGYKKKGIGSVVVGEENFGEGSSREHAAMEPRFLNVKVIIVKSFARIHETNLKKQGVLTLTFAEKQDYDKIREDDRFDITGLKEILPGKQLTVILNHSDGTKERFAANHTYNYNQIEWFRAGSALNLIRKGNKNQRYD
jgi:aconitate hydratase